MQAGPLTVSHTGQLPSVTMSFNLNPGVALGDAVAAIQQLAANTLPAAADKRFGYSSKRFQELRKWQLVRKTSSPQSPA